MQKIVTKEIDLNGRILKLETGKLAKQADAAVVARLGDTVVLATVSCKPLTVDPGYFPLSVEYVEKYYAGGIITGQRFIKRETRPSEKAVLSGRAIDRAIRPLFPKDFKAEVQLIINVLSYDGINDPAIVGFIAGSAAFSISSVPFAGPVGVVRISESEGNLVVNPDLGSAELLKFNLTVAATSEKVIMIEAEAAEVPEDKMLQAIKKGFEESQPIIGLINEFVKEAGKEKQTFVALSDQIEAELMKTVKVDVKERIEKALFDKEHPWHDATGYIIKGEIEEVYKETLTPIQVQAIFEKVAKEIVHDLVLNKHKRVDGREMEEIRPISIEIGLLPRAHGSAVFQRGDTQVLSIATLGPLSLSQTLEGMEGESLRRFMHHYNMGINPFSTGEVKRITGPSRRDIGHGNLGERAIVPVLPTEEEFPYAIRAVSEILGGNGSTSQASICATTLSLLNAGVPIKPVAGIAMGLFSDEKTFQVVTDMPAVEDFFGEMDFKIAGTTDGITAIQMDTKLNGLTFEIIEEALRQGKNARDIIIAKMKEVMPKEGELSQYAPKIEVTHIKPEEIGLLIGSGGKTINGIIAKTGAQIDIEDDGTVMVSSTDQAAINAALEAIEGMFKKVLPGEEYDGKVVKLAPFGAFVEIVPGKDGLVHVSQMAPYRVEAPEDIVKEGQEVHVRVLDVDSQGKISLSMLFGADIKPDRPREERGRRDDRGGDRGGSRGGDRNRGGGDRRFGGGQRRDFGRKRDR